MEAKALVSGLGDALTAIAALTGLKVDESFVKPFTQTFMRFMKTYYGMISVGEITLAFELNAANELPTKIVCYGQNLTLDHIGAVLYSYKQKRAELARKMENVQLPGLPEPTLTPEQIEMDEKQFANEYYRKFLNNEFSSVSLEYAHGVYDILDRRREINISVAQKKEYFNQAQKIRDAEISAPSLSKDERKENNRLVEAYLNGVIPVAEQELVKQYAKRIALLDLFKQWQSAKRTKIFII